MKKRTFLLALLLIAACVLSACGQNSGQYLKFYLTAEPKNLDPQLADDPASLTVIGNLFEGLVRLNDEGEIVPAGCKNYTVSDDQKTYTFQIRDDAKWSDGQKVIAGHYSFGILRALTKSTGAPYARLLFGIKNARAFYNGEVNSKQVGVATPDDATLVITLEAPNERFLTALTYPVAFPCPYGFFNNTKGRYGMESEAVIANGPFQLKNWLHGEDPSLNLRKNDAYHSPADVLPAGINLPVVSDTDFAINRFEAKVVDAITLPPAQLSEVEEQQPVLETFRSTTYLLVFNQKSAVFKNKTLREAFALAIDPQTLKKDQPAYLSAADRILPPAVTLPDTARSASIKPAYQPDTAKTRYQTGLAALQKDKLPMTTLLVPDNDALKRVAANLQESWKTQLGAILNIEPLPDKDYQTMLKSGQYDCAIVPATSSQDDLQSFLLPFTSNNAQNVFGYASSDYDNLVAAVADATSGKAAADAALSAERKLVSDAICYPLYFEDSVFVRQSGVSGIRFSPFGCQADFRSAQKAE